MSLRVMTFVVCTSFRIYNLLKVQARTHGNTPQLSGLAAYDSELVVSVSC